MKLLFPSILSLVLVSGCSMPTKRTPASLGQAEGRVQFEKFFISDLNNFKAQNGTLTRSYEMDLNGARAYTLALVNTTKFKNLEARLECDDQNKKFKIKRSSKHRIGARLKIKSGNGCKLFFENPEQPSEIYGTILSNQTEDTVLADLQDYVDECALPAKDEHKGVERFFLTSEYTNMTCPQKIGDAETLEGPIQSIKVKAEVLLGSPIPDEMMETKNPYLPLDFSKAPKLNAILLSHLVYRADFSGTLIARLLKFHAERGTKVRIMTSYIAMIQKDKDLLHELQEHSDNIRIHELRYDSKRINAGDQIAEIHRTNHIKLFMTLSDNQKDNIVIFGGRNIHDGFVFTGVPDHSKHPKMVHYGKGKDLAWTYWRDFEMLVRNKALADRVAAHYLTAWEMDKRHFTIRSINKKTAVTKSVPSDYFELAQDENKVRHMISVPYRDGMQLEKFFIDMFDSAEKIIRISTPYFRPTKAVGNALKRAVERGVQISLITRLDLKGDTADFILGEVNKAGMNRFLNQIKIYEYTEPDAILHSKLILIDDKFSFISSVNMNKRSFYHDTENGLMIYGPGFNQKMTKILAGYYDISREITTKQKVVLWKKIVIGLFDKAL